MLNTYISVTITNLLKLKIINLRIFETRLDAQHLQHDQEAINSFMEQVTVKKTATQFVPGEPDYWSVVVFYENGRPKPKSPSVVAEPETELTDEQREIVAALKQWRKDRAREINQPEYIICHNSTLDALSIQKPRTLIELNDVRGFGASKIAKYGEDVIAVLNAF